MLTPFVGNGLCVDLDVVDFEDLQQKLRIVSDALNRNRERETETGTYNLINICRPLDNHRGSWREDSLKS
jgi:hypothetical protein